MDRRLTLAFNAIDKVLATARKYGLEVTIAVVDSSGDLVAAARQDLAAYASFDAARKKACTAAALKLPTAALTEMIANDPIGQRALAANPELLAVPGGFPLFLDGACIGAIGVAGGAWSDDQMVGAEALIEFKP
jgi:uncharacterized protein GlcG (DUF336 family)